MEQEHHMSNESSTYFIDEPNAYFVSDSLKDEGSIHGGLFINDRKVLSGTMRIRDSIDEMFGGKPWRVEYLSNLTNGANVLPKFMSYEKNDGSNCQDFAYFQRLCSNGSVQIVRACIECGYLPDGMKNEPHANHPKRDEYPILGQHFLAWEAAELMEFIHCNEFAISVKLHQFTRLISCDEMPSRISPSFKWIAHAEQVHDALDYLYHWNDAVDHINAPSGIKKALKYGLVEVQNFGGKWAVDILLEIDFDADKYAKQIGEALSERIRKPAPDGCVVVGLHRVDCANPFTKVTTYKDYLASQRWSDRKKRERIRLTGKPDGKIQCENPDCVSGEGPFDLHHHTYDRVGHEFSGDLAFLCRGCHSAFESIKRMAPAA
jgi:hypothetical protein